MSAVEQSNTLRDRDGSIRRKAAPKSPDPFAEEIRVRVERHGIARYSKDWCLPVTKRVDQKTLVHLRALRGEINELRWYRGANASSSFGRGVFV